MNYLLKNGDAHLKNFGVIYDNEFKNINFSPAYDIVTTTAYIYKDKPALMMFGKKVWWGKQELVRFGVEHCYFSKSEALQHYAICMEALKSSLKVLEEAIEKDEKFAPIGLKMLASWHVSLDEKTYKEIPRENF
jgi:serine/threonine-protein kinase HipA